MFGTYVSATAGISDSFEQQVGLYAYFWAVACLVSAAWILMFLPELRDRTFEEIDEMVSPAWHQPSSCAFPGQARPDFVLISCTSTGQKIERRTSLTAFAALSLLTKTRKGQQSIFQSQSPLRTRRWLSLLDGTCAKVRRP